VLVLTKPLGTQVNHFAIDDVDATT
jgi:hypothetical protein